WIGWLIFLAASTTGEPVLSRPQFLVADLCVIAGLKGDADHPAAEVVVHQVVWSAGLAGQERGGNHLTVANLPESGPKLGWNGPGDYVLALTRRKDAK